MPAQGATPVTHRALAPDLARGLMLLLIALAHAHMYLGGHPVGFRGYALDGGTPDRPVAGVQILLVDGRALPMFAALFGYGLVQLANRQLAAGRSPSQVRAVLRRRSLWLPAFGFCHALLLFFGDILGAYGLVGLVLAGFVLREDRTVLRAAVAGLVAHVVVMVAFGLLTVSGPKGDTPAAMADPIEATMMRLIGWSGMTPTYFAASVLPAFLFGVWDARRRLLEEPLTHRDLLVRVAILGIGLAVAGGAPLALIDTGAWAPSDLVAVSAYVLHSLTGVAGGLAYAASGR
ncbi:DUF418 domain-containing protein [Nonomuraea wenchangensis]|uniref:DUF418 domain-containing protein n=1 Tax=Nonomuraea wenchangensis TaxID=568860 RepID=UPI00331AF042